MSRDAVVTLDVIHCPHTLRELRLIGLVKQGKLVLPLIPQKRFGGLVVVTVLAHDDGESSTGRPVSHHLFQRPCHGHSVAGEHQDCDDLRFFPGLVYRFLPLLELVEHFVVGSELRAHVSFQRDCLRVQDAVQAVLADMQEYESGHKGPEKGAGQQKHVQPFHGRHRGWQRAAPTTTMLPPAVQLGCCRGVCSGTFQGARECRIHGAAVRSTCLTLFGRSRPLRKI
ncbi:hypothetical protein MTO96_013326 [Rhipicephalus appendiculatus]